MPATAAPCFCPNCGDATLDNGTPAVAATPTTPAVAAVPPDARCPSCTMRVQDTGVAGPLWPTALTPGTPPPHFPVDPATGAVRLPTGVLTPPWVVIPTPAPGAPGPGAPTPTTGPWYTTGPGIAVIALGGALALGLGVWAIRGDATDRPPVLPVNHLSADPADDPCHGVCARGTRCVPAGDWGPATCVADPNSGGFNPPAPTDPVNRTVNVGGDVPVVAPATPPQPQPVCSATTHPRPVLIDLAAGGSDGVTIAASGAPQDCEVPPNGTVTPWVNTSTSPPQVLAWYCCTPEVRQAAR